MSSSGPRRAATAARRGRTPRTPRSSEREEQRPSGFEWLVVSDPDFEDLVTTVHAIAQELEDGGFGSQLLAALFPFEGKFQGEPAPTGSTASSRGAFSPFVPTGKGQERDNAEELELKAKLDPELPIEPDLTRWFGLFGAPL